jgi:transposase-like protein
MDCPHCAATATRKRAKKTKLGYATCFCPKCKYVLNEQTGTPFNDLEFSTDIVLLVVFWRLRYKVSLRDVAEMFLERGFIFTHETVRDWEERFAPLIADQLRTRATWSSREHPGMWMRDISKCMENGAISRACSKLRKYEPSKEPNDEA